MRKEAFFFVFLVSPLVSCSEQDLAAADFEPQLRIHRAEVDFSGQMSLEASITNDSSSLSVCFSSGDKRVELRDIGTGLVVRENSERVTETENERIVVRPGVSLPVILEFGPWQDAFLEDSDGLFLKDLPSGSKLNASVGVLVYDCRFSNFAEASKFQATKAVWTDLVPVQGEVGRFIENS